MKGIMETQKIRISSVARGIGRRLLSPRHAVKALRLHRHRKLSERSEIDPQLALYAKIIGDHLHLGYFDDPAVPPEEMSLGSIRRAQENYTLKIMHHIEDLTQPVLDVGCGMGGLLKVLEQVGVPAIGVTPDDRQVKQLRATRKSPIWHGRFEDISGIELGGRFGSVVTAESLQYLDRKILFQKIRESLLPGGRWILIDYLDRTESDCIRPTWEFLEKEISKQKLRTLHVEDITAHILPTVRFLHFLGDRFAVPIFDFLEMKLKVKEPGIAYLVDDATVRLREVLESNLAIVDAERFTRLKAYRLMVVSLQ